MVFMSIYYKAVGVGRIFGHELVSVELPIPAPILQNAGCPGRKMWFSAGQRSEILLLKFRRG